jgi:hypothetical protein
MLVGLIFVCVGVTCYGTWALWLFTRINRPVNVPIAMTVGHVRTPVFKVNRAAFYDIEIKVQKTIPFEILNCLLGTAMAQSSTDLQECPDKPSVVKASWILSSDGKIVAQGSTDDLRSGAWENNSISRELGFFKSQKGRPYVLDVDVLAGGSSLAAGNPHLEVEVSPAVYEDEMVLGAILFFLAAGLILVGMVTSLAAFVKTWRARRLTDPTKVGGA